MTIGYGDWLKVSRKESHHLNESRFEFIGVKLVGVRGESGRLGSLERLWMQHQIMSDVNNQQKIRSDSQHGFAPEKEV